MLECKGCGIEFDETVYNDGSKYCDICIFNRHDLELESKELYDKLEKIKNVIEAHKNLLVILEGEGNSKEVIEGWLEDLKSQSFDEIVGIMEDTE